MEKRCSRRDRCNYILSGPNNSSLLYAQIEYRSETIRQQIIGSGAICCKRTDTILHLDDIPEQIISHLWHTCFYSVIQLALNYCLIEQWQSEIHKFIFPKGKMTIIIQDMG